MVVKGTDTDTGNAIKGAVVIDQRHYVTAAGDNLTQPGAQTYCLPIPLPGGQELWLHYGETTRERLRQHFREQATEAVCRRECCQERPVLPGLGRFVA